MKRLRYNSKKRVPRIKTIATPLVFSFILIIKCVSGSKKLLTIFGGSESKQKQNSKLVGPHQSFILHSNPKMECLTVFILFMLYFCEWLHQKLIYYSKLWEIEGHSHPFEKVRHIHDLNYLHIFKCNFGSNWARKTFLYSPESWNEFPQLGYSCEMLYHSPFGRKIARNVPPSNFSEETRRFFDSRLAWPFQMDDFHNFE